MPARYKGKLNGPCQIYFSFGRLRRASTVSQCEEKWLDGFRKCPITGGLLLPVGFPLEQLSVSVSLGKPREHGANDASVLKETSRAFNASQQLFVSVLRTPLELPGFSGLYQVVSQRLRVGPLTNFLDCLRRQLTSPLSVRVKRFSVNERAVKERAAAARGSSSSSC